MFYLFMKKKITYKYIFDNCAYKNVNVQMQDYLDESFLQTDEV